MLNCRIVQLLKISVVELLHTKNEPLKTILKKLIINPNFQMQNWKNKMGWLRYCQQKALVRNLIQFIYQRTDVFMPKQTIFSRYASR